MKKLLAVTAVALAVGLLMPATTLAAKADGKKAKLVAKYDKNQNGALEGDELEALRKDFEKDKQGELKAYDTDQDGKLSDEEIQAIKPGAGKKAKESATGDKGNAKGKEKKGAKKEGTDKAKTEGKSEGADDSKAGGEEQSKAGGAEKDTAGE